MAAKKGKTGPGSNEPFVYEFDGETITLPSLAMVEAGFVRRVRKLDQADQLFTLIEEKADADALAAIDRMTAPEFTKFQKAWRAHSGIGLGE